MKDANLEDPDGKNIEEEQLPVTTYKIIEPPPVILDDSLLSASKNINSDVNAAVSVEKPASKPPTTQPPSHESFTDRMRRFAENPTRFYAAIGAGMGVLLAIVTAAIYLGTGAPEGRYDLGPVTSSATGLKGHLYINWEKTLRYRVTFETSDPDQQAGFALAVANTPHPLSIEIQLQNTQGFVLCSREILLKYDARSTAIAANLPNKPPPASDIAPLEAQEKKREQGKDIFQKQISPKGQVVALNAQGEIPCSAKAYENTVQWSFTSNFPSLAEQDEGLERQQEMRARAAQRDAARKAANKAAEKLLPFSTEGDDAIVEFDVSRGVIVTSGRKTFFLDKTSMGSTSPVWQDYPVSIHFRCDQSTNCTLMHAGAGALRARLKR
ncbi:MAG: hypothetical protein ABR990_05020 [Terracidiphilus sp.]|jgi:hypothetical protein